MTLPNYIAREADKVGASDTALYSDAVLLKERLAEKGINIRAVQAHNFTSAGTADLIGRLTERERQIASMLPTPESRTKNLILADIQWAIACIREELDRRDELAAAAE